MTCNELIDRMTDYTEGDLVEDTRHQFELSFDILNVGNLINSSWGVRKVADPAATSPLKLVGFDGAGAPEFNFVGPATTFIDDPSPLSRWQMQLGLRYMLN